MIRTDAPWFSLRPGIRRQSYCIFSVDISFSGCDLTMLKESCVRKLDDLGLYAVARIYDLEVVMVVNK